ncbi:SUMF1/EgtB/PvdO family nonheme iron enzyme [Amycolatopsis nigrescens]|uniref:SUMF1/EgtB/PvdO family nonheme iron enzyme n=1 Tax=Amycolatopsis nigrescens TaxID=381445 RepID=UPI0003778E19|nr:SUMF1/EgtB/PvdO family nonheme iron enzyme [Amycolatopsis nigrescens]
MARRGASDWDRYCEYFYLAGDLGLSLDISRVRFDEGFLAKMAAPMAGAFDAMAALEAGASANRDEDRMVGHYWLRDPGLAPDEVIGAEIRAAQLAVIRFAGQIRRGEIVCAHGSCTDFVHVGIGGSAVGPQLLHEAWHGATDPIAVHFLDNSDPDGLERLLDRLHGRLGRTLVSVVSKSGVTPTPWHVLLELEAAYRRAGLDFARHAVATTVEGGKLDRRAVEQGWLARFPLWDWVGGRTSVTSAVGLLPAAMLGADVGAFLDGAAAMDRHTRIRSVRQNPAALLALMWHWLGEGRGEKNMVLLPYQDRLAGLPRWVQQLVMESLGKRLDRAGRTVHQGLTVYGYKGSSDQHAYLQQLRDGTADSFITFVRVQRERRDCPAELETGSTLGDHLFGGMEGTREALSERGRDSITVTVPDSGARSLGALVALYERAVGLYAELIDVNAYHQPGVDKYAAEPVPALRRQVLDRLAAEDSARTAGELADAIGQPARVELVYKLLVRLAANEDRVVAVPAGGGNPRDARFEYRMNNTDKGGPEELNRILLPAELYECLIDSVIRRYPRKSFGYLASPRAVDAPTEFVLFEENIRNDEAWRDEFESRGRYFVDHPDAGFVATPAESWRVQKYLRKRNLAEVALFHTHRRHPGGFSEIDYDLHLGRFRHSWHLIISLRNVRQPQARAFAVSEHGVRELHVQIGRGGDRRRPRQAKDRVIEEAREVLALDRAGFPVCDDSGRIFAALRALERAEDQGPFQELVAEGFLAGADERYHRFVERDMRELGGRAFLMGTDPADARHFCGETPCHHVELSRFLLSAVAVTNELFALFEPGRLELSGQGAVVPAVDVTWFDAAVFARWMGCRLPTEAEWEFACGAGGDGQWCCPEEELGRYAWYSENSERYAHPVGTKQANSLGLFDLHGNVWEWCQDDYLADFYARSPSRDPVAGTEATEHTETHKVSRGGGFLALTEMCRTRYRLHDPADYSAPDLGFRLARGRFD